MDWKKFPHFFSNGKFEIESKYRTAGRVALRGCITYPEGVVLVSDWGHEYIGDCTLIARPISDITRVEVIDIMGGIVSDNHISDFIIHSESYTSRQVMRLISFGIYPFGDENFDKYDMLARCYNTNK